MKKLLFAVVMLVIAGIMVFAAGGSQNPSAASSGSQADLYNPPGTMPIVKRPVTLSIFSVSNTEQPWENNLMTKELEAKTGIKLAWRYAAQDAFRERLNLMFASGDETDLIFTGTFQAVRLDKATEAQLGSQGLIIPLEKYYDTVSVGYKAGMARIAGAREYITTPDGHIYCLPNFDINLGVEYLIQNWINTKWLDKLGLKMPETIDDYYNVLKAFKERDPNGSGTADEIPLSTCKTGAGVQIDGYVMAPFQLVPDESTSGKMYVENKVVKYAPVQDGYREGLRFMHKLFVEGLLNPESFTQLARDQVNRNESGPHEVIGSFLALRLGYACDMDSVPNSNRWTQYQPMPALRGPSGKAVIPWSPYNGFQTGQNFITGKCKYPEAAFRLIDYIATPEGTMRSRFGVRGEDYVDAAPGEAGLDGRPARIKQLGTSLSTRAWGQLAGSVGTPDITNMFTVPTDPYDQTNPLWNSIWASVLLSMRGAMLLEPFKQPMETVFPNLYFDTAVAEEVGRLKIAISDYQNEAVARFITGQLDVDKDWDSYKKQLSNIGLDRYMALNQDAYSKSAFSKR